MICITVSYDLIYYFFKPIDLLALALQQLLSDFIMFFLLFENSLEFSIFAN